MDRSFDAQFSARLTAKELQDLQKDMFGWSASMKQKNARKAPAAEPARAPEPVAGASQSSGTSQQQRNPAAATKHPAAHTYENYRSKWDKFDVDAALAEADGEAGRRAERSNGAPASSASGGGSRGASSAGQPACIPEARVTVPVGPSPPRQVPQPAVSQGGAAASAARSAPKTAGEWKDAGNEHFKAGRYQEAVECYTSSLAAQPSCVAAANRALARLKMGQPAAAEEDCSLGLAMDPAYVKAYLRRATARHELGNLLGAVQDCEAALRLEPGNRQAAADREAHVAALLRQRGLQAPSRSVPLAVRCKPLAGAGPATGALQAADLVLTSAAQLTATGAAAAAGAEEIIRAAATHPSPAVQPATAAPAVARIQVVEQVEEEEGVPPLEEREEQTVQQQQAAWEGLARGLGTADGARPAAPSSPGSVQADGGPLEVQLAGERRGSAPAAGTPPAVELAPPKAESPPAPGAEILPASRPGSATAAEAAPFKMPRSGLEFEKAWRGFKGDQQQQAGYLLQLPPTQLPVLLKQALSPNLLAAATAALLQQAAGQDPATALALLEGLTGVARFDINLLSVPPRQRGELSAAWDAAAARLDAALAGRLAGVRAKYKL